MQRSSQHILKGLDLESKLKLIDQHSVKSTKDNDSGLGAKSFINSVAYSFVPDPPVELEPFETRNMYFD